MDPLDLTFPFATSSHSTESNTLSPLQQQQQQQQQQQSSHHSSSIFDNMLTSTTATVAATGITSTTYADAVGSATIGDHFGSLVFDSLISAPSSSSIYTDGHCQPDTPVHEDSADLSAFTMTTTSTNPATSTSKNTASDHSYPYSRSGTLRSRNNKRLSIATSGLSPALLGMQSLALPSSAISSAISPATATATATATAAAILGTPSSATSQTLTSAMSPVLFNPMRAGPHHTGRTGTGLGSRPRHRLSISHATFNPTTNNGIGLGLGLGPQKTNTFIKDGNDCSAGSIGSGDGTELPSLATVGRLQSCFTDVGEQLTPTMNTPLSASVATTDLQQPQKTQVDDVIPPLLMHQVFSSNSQQQQQCQLQQQQPQEQQQQQQQYIPIDIIEDPSELDIPSDIRHFHRLTSYRWDEERVDCVQISVDPSKIPLTYGSKPAPTSASILGSNNSSTNDSRRYNLIHKQSSSSSLSVTSVSSISNGRGNISSNSNNNSNNNNSGNNNNNTSGCLNGDDCEETLNGNYIVTRRLDNNMINGTKLLNITRMTRGRRDGILKNEKRRKVIRIGAMPLKGVWIPFERAVALAKIEGVFHLLLPLFADDPLLYIRQYESMRIKFLEEQSKKILEKEVEEMSNNEKLKELKELKDLVQSNSSLMPLVNYSKSDIEHSSGQQSAATTTTTTTMATNEYQQRYIELLQRQPQVQIQTEAQSVDDLNAQGLGISHNVVSTTDQATLPDWFNSWLTSLPPPSHQLSHTQFATSDMLLPPSTLSASLASILSVPEADKSAVPEHSCITDNALRLLFPPQNTTDVTSSTTTTDVALFNTDEIGAAIQPVSGYIANKSTSQVTPPVDSNIMNELDAIFNSLPGTGNNSNASSDSSNSSNNGGNSNQSSAALLPTLINLDSIPSLFSTI